MCAEAVRVNILRRIESYVLNSGSFACASSLPPCTVKTPSPSAQEFLQYSGARDENTQKMPSFKKYLYILLLYFGIIYKISGLVFQVGVVF